MGGEGNHTGDKRDPILPPHTPQRVIPEFAQQTTGTQKAQQNNALRWVAVFACGKTGKTAEKFSRQLIRPTRRRAHLQRMDITAPRPEIWTRIAVFLGALRVFLRGAVPGKFEKVAGAARAHLMAAATPSSVSQSSSTPSNALQTATAQTPPSSNGP